MYICMCTRVYLYVCVGIYMRNACVCIHVVLKLSVQMGLLPPSLSLERERDRERVAL